MPRRNVYRVVFVAGCIAVLGGIGLGIYESVKTERQLPAVNISNIGEIQRLLDAGRFDEAIPRLGMALELIPQNHQVLLNMRGNARNALELYDEAIVDFRRAIEIDPGFAEAYNNLGIAYIGTDALGLAVVQFDRAVRVNPTFAVARQNLEHAVRDFETLTGLDSGDPETQRILAEAHHTLTGSSPSTPAAVAESEELLEARTFVQRFFDEELDWLHAGFSIDFAARMSLDDLRRFRLQLSDRLGIETKLLGDRLVPTDSGFDYRRWSRFNKFPGVVELTFELREDWTVNDLRIRLSETEPDNLR